MLGEVFHTVVNDTGHLGVQYNHSNAIMTICYRSPHASLKSNDWLERKLVKLYTAYYFKVLLETKGRFWEDTCSSGMKYAKGGKEDGSKI